MVGVFGQCALGGYWKFYTFFLCLTSTVAIAITFSQKSYSAFLRKEIQ